MNNEAPCFERMRPTHCKEKLFYPYEWRITISKKGRKRKENK